jgi:carbamoyltransferase
MSVFIATQSAVESFLNTLLNENEPVVRAPAEAISCFLRTGMDVVVLDNGSIDRHRSDFPEQFRKRVARSV